MRVRPPLLAPGCRYGATVQTCCDAFVADLPKDRLYMVRGSTMRVAMMVFPALAMLGLEAAAKEPAGNGIELHDVPGTKGEWQEGVAIVSAPAATVHYWLTDYANWP